MLVGILVMVIVIAVIWDRQSGELTRTARPGKGEKSAVIRSELSPSLTDGSEEAEGEITLVEKSRETLEAEKMMELLKEQVSGSQKSPAPVQEALKEVEPPPKKETSTDTTYIVGPGESIWLIADKFYGDGSKWKVIWEHNIDLLPKPEMIREGQTIRVPKLDATKVKLPVEPEISIRQSGADQERHYTVERGDCLGIISQKFYGTSKKWKLILEANNLEDETSLRAGMKIVIPPDKN
jgi:nucleoid-associated protein YgaU